MRNVPTFEEFVNESKGSDIVAIANTRSGEVPYDRDEIQEFLDDLDMYWSADNLPKWLFACGRTSSRCATIKILKIFLQFLKLE